MVIVDSLAQIRPHLVEVGIERKANEKHILGQCINCSHLDLDVLALHGFAEHLDHNSLFLLKVVSHTHLANNRGLGAQVHIDRAISDLH